MRQGDKRVTVFEYLYRDAGNYKVYGSILLEGQIAFDEMQIIRSRFDGDDLFIAEQLGIPPLYEKLYKWSGGPTSDDHCWHEFAGIGNIDDAAARDQPIWGTAMDFVARVLAIKEWRAPSAPIRSA